MSYKTRIDGHQIFGNNDYFPAWIDFVKSQGIEVDDDGLYEGETTDVQGMFSVIDTITRNLIAERDDRIKNGEKGLDGKPLTRLTDLSDSIFLDEKTPLLMFNQYMIGNAYCFLPYQAYIAVKDKIEHADEVDEKEGLDWAFCSYKIKDGMTITLSAS